ncbi:MAG: hypothetical protein Kow00117_07020 [Phototrophicales bacterium]
MWSRGQALLPMFLPYEHNTTKWLFMQSDVFIKLKEFDKYEAFYFAGDVACGGFCCTGCTGTTR